MSTPLLNENIEVNLKDLQNEYLNFSRNLGELKKYNEKLSICSKREFNQFKNDLESLQKSLIQNIAKINNLSKNLKSQETTNSELNEKIKDQIKIIDDRYPDKIKEYKTLLIQIIENSKKFSMMNSSPSESFRQSEISQNSISSFGEHNLQIYEYKEDKLFQERQEEIEDAKKVSSELSKLSEVINTKVKNQGEMINDIENNVIEVQENTKKANKEINEVDKITKKQNKRIFSLLIFIVVLLLIIFYILRQYILLSE